MKRMIAGMVAALLAAILLFPCRAQAVSAQNAVLMDAASGRVLYEKNGDKQGLIASTTKIMTALIVCEQCNVLDRVRIPKEAVGIEGSSLYLKEGEVLTVQALLYGLMLHSGNDAAIALAIYCGGTVEGFVGLMNDKAHRLELNNTHFANPNGLDSPGHYASAKDLAVLTCYAMENPIFRQTVSSKTITIEGRSLRNHNKLLWQVDGCDGVKTGYTKAAGRILVSTAQRDGRRLVAVTMNAPDDWQDHKSLLEQGFSAYQLRQIVYKDQLIGTIDVLGGTEQTVPVLAADDFIYAMRDDEQISIVLSDSYFAYAPVVAGQQAGLAYICLNGSCVVGRVPLYYGNTVEMLPQKQSFFKKLLGGQAQ